MRDMGVFIISPSDKGGMLYKPPARLVDLCQPLHPLVFNVLFCLCPAAGPHAEHRRRMSRRFRSARRRLPLLDRNDELLPPIQERLRRPWSTRWARNWPIVTPRDCPPGRTALAT